MNSMCSENFTNFPLNVYEKYENIVIVALQDSRLVIPKFYKKDFFLQIPCTSCISNKKLENCQRHINYS